MKLSEEEKKKWLDNWEIDSNTKNLQDIDKKLKNIMDIPPVQIKVPEWVMDRLKETSNHYVRGEWLSTIVVCGIIAEFITFKYIEEHIKKEEIKFYEEFLKRLSQQGRLGLLRLLKLVKEDNCKKLDQIKKIRNKYVHLKILDDQIRAKNDALTTLKLIIDFLNSEKRLFADYSLIKAI